MSRRHNDVVLPDPRPNAAALSTLWLRAVAIVAVMLFVGVVLAGSSTVFAHSGLAAASPGPGSTVGGRIDEIQLYYGDFIAAIDGSVTAPDGTVLDTTFAMTSDIAATINLGSRLDTPGEYAVRHNVTSIDGDRVEAAYLFTYDPTAPAPQLVFNDDDRSRPLALWLVAGTGGAVIAVLATRLAISLRRRHHATQTAPPPP